MPNRIIRDGILESHAVNRLSPEAELFYRRLLSIVDDFGRYEWDAQKLRLRAMGLRYDWATLEQVQGWMAECAKEVVKVYEVGGTLYGQLEKWKDKPRASKSKFPSYEESTAYREIAMHVQADAMQMQADDSTCKHLRPNSNAKSLSKSLSNPTPIDFPTNPNPNTEDVWAEPADPSIIFMEAYPKQTGIQLAIQTYQSVVKQSEHAEVLAGLERWKQSEAWAKDDGMYIPEAHKWLTDRRWKDHPKPRAQPKEERIIFMSDIPMRRDMR